ncbi:restriction endonuclease subunit S [Cycloclasticus sp. P1]|uniref:restriction endonuclease subunit S n=1 Tax=Cycloclasticus sp. (strain P1) TaxID=385025 RepID=UPI000286A7CA|nr:restriction endonuclease subunit S [Cycloclasticus sp. P1]AFT67168.1 Restriction endonuclease S subunit [Cycloclasticus sp. P1]
MNHENVYENLPDDWKVVPFSEVMDIQGGSQPAKKFFKSEPQEGYIRLLQIRDFGKKPVPTFVPKDLVTKFCKKDDIFIARYGASLGRILTGMEGAYNVALAKVLYERDFFDKGYLFYLLKTPIFQTPIKMISRSAQNGFNKDDLRPIKIPIAPLEQQKRIVAKIEELFSHIDAGIDALNKAKQLLKQYRQSVLKAAVTGELTKQWREDRLKDDVQGSTSAAGAGSAGAAKLEPASQLLERILKERRQKWETQQLAQFKAKGKVPKDDKWKGKYPEPNIDVKKFFEEPTGWAWAEIGTVTDMLSGHAFKKAEYTGSGVRLFQIANVSFGHTKWDEVEHLPESYLKDWANLSLNEGDILMALNRPLLSKRLKISRLSKADVPAILYQRVGKFQFYSDLISDYFLIYMQSHFYINRLEEQLQGVNIPFINKGKLLETPISIPSSIQEMEMIVEKVNSKLASIDRIENEIQVHLKKAETNKQSILASAFSGKLN